MAENVNITAMAELLSSEMFSEFMWETRGPMNHDWRCEQAERHGHATHPCDVVFFYDEPYSNSRTYVHCDLKSYKKGSITSSNIKSALKSLAKQISCAEISGEWQTLHTHEGYTINIAGLLFIYNHDGEFDKEFDGMLDTVKTEDLDIPKRGKLVVFGPSDIRWMDNVQRDIIELRGRGKLPSRSNCGFFHPELVRKIGYGGPAARAATLEMLTSPWIIMEHRDVGKVTRGITVFVRRGGKARDFMYLIDMLRQYQVINAATSISIRMSASYKDAKLSFQEARQEYLRAYRIDAADPEKGRPSGKDPTEDTGPDFEDLLARIEFGSMTNALTVFSELEVGMRYENQ